MSRRLVLTVMAVVMVAGLAVGGNGFYKVRQMQRELDVLEKEIVQLRARTVELTRTVDRLRNDPAYIEQRVREDLGWVRDGETVLKFPSQKK